MNTEDITESRHGGNEESQEAYASVVNNLPRVRKHILLLVENAGDNGLTCRELAALWDVPMHTISGRFSELKRDGLIRKIGVRERSAVMVVA